MKKTKENKEKNDKERKNYDRQYSSYFAVRPAAAGRIQLIACSYESAAHTTVARSIIRMVGPLLPHRSRGQRAATCRRIRKPATAWATAGAAQRSNQSRINTSSIPPASVSTELPPSPLQRLFPDCFPAPAPDVSPRTQARGVQPGVLQGEQRVQGV